MSQKKLLLKSVAVLSIATITSRIFGLGRDILTAHFFGTTSACDCFILAFMIPNFIKTFLFEGSLNSSFIPVFLTSIAQGKKKEAFDMARSMFHIVFMIMTILTSTSFLCLSLILHLPHISAKMALTCRLIQWMLPYIFVISLCFVLIAILNAHRRFFLSSLSPILLNIFWILSFFLFCPYMGNRPEEQIFGLILGIFLSGLFQLFFYLRVCYTLNFRLFPLSLGIHNPAIKKIAILTTPIIGIFILNHFNSMIDIFWAHFLGEGTQSSLWYSQRIIYCPLGIFGVAMSVAITPYLSEYINKNDLTQLKKKFLYGIKLVSMLVLPSSLFIFLRGKDIVSLFFERGHFDSISVERTALPLTFYSLGLLFFAINKILLSVYYSFKDTKTPFIASSISILTNLIMNALFVSFLQQGGLALATSLSSLLTTILLMKGLVKKLGFFLDRLILIQFIKILFATVMGGIGSVLIFELLKTFHMTGNLMKVCHVFIPLTTQFAIAFVFYYIFHIRDLFSLLNYKNTP